MAAGNVARQLPAAGQAVTPGSQVAILVSTGKPDETVAIPAVKGKTQAEAEAALRGAGFEPLVVEDYRADTEKGKVSGQLPEACEKLPKGSTVAIGVSLGAPK